LRVIWLSSKELGTSLSSTTIIELANGLVRKGHELIVYSPGNPKDVEFKHNHVSRSKIRGFQSRSIVKNLKKRRAEFSAADVVLIDWPIFKIAKYISAPVILMDRSPPADPGFLSQMQWPVWINAWRKAQRGTAVSDMHVEVIMSVIESITITADIEVIQAGVDLDKFKPGVKEGPIKLAYIGRVDVNRGVMSLAMILSGLNETGVDATLHIHGTGDAIPKLKNIGLKGMEITESLPQDELASRLSNYDIGFLPMPESAVWGMASPLKRSEYLASGMVVCGIDHSGHKQEGAEDCSILFEEEEFISRTVNWLRKLTRDELSVMQEKARNFAEANLSWDHSIDVLDSMIRE
jgi:glycosyltransferase involved in cell wall biosynthesis